MSIVICKLTKPLMGYSKNAIVITDSECAMIGMIIDKGDEHLGWYVDTLIKRDIHESSDFKDIQETGMSNELYEIMFKLIQKNKLKLKLKEMLEDIIKNDTLTKDILG